MLAVWALQAVKRIPFRYPRQAKPWLFVPRQYRQPPLVAPTVGARPASSLRGEQRDAPAENGFPQKALPRHGEGGLCDVAGYKCSILSPSSDFMTSDFNFPVRRLAVSSSTPLLTVLVTPSLSAFLNEDDEFISNVVRRLFGLLPTGFEIDIVAAVVDQISLPFGKPFDLHTIDGHRFSSEFEGISLMLADSSTVAPELWSSQSTFEADPELAPQPAILALEFLHSLAKPIVPYMAVNGPHKIYTVHLPLANTVFQNGYTSTLFAQRLEVTSTEDSRNHFRCVKRSRLGYQKLNLVTPWLANGQPEIAISRTVVDLTPPRVIASSMGNIIRSFRARETSEELMSASEELEMAITRKPSWLSPGQDFELWAKVTPKDRWSSLPKVLVAKDQAHQFESGSRLHRVISGGGGWGNTQGLISLDPYMSFASAFETNGEIVPDKEDLEARLPNALREVVTRGDVVQFQAFVRGPTKRNENRKALLECLQEGVQPLLLESSPSIVVGSLAPLSDEELVNSSEDEMPTSKSSYILCDGHFGALSETGLSFTISLVTDDGNATHWGAQEMGTIVQTKLPSISRVYSPSQE